MKAFSTLLSAIKEFQILILSISILLSSTVLSIAIINHKGYPRYVHLADSVFFDNKTKELKAVRAIGTKTVAKIEDEQ